MTIDVAEKLLLELADAGGLRSQDGRATDPHVGTLLAQVQRHNVV